MTQVELATAAGITQAGVSDIERGQTKLPNATIRRALAEALEVSHLDLLIAAGELDRDEVELMGLQGVPDLDPIREELIAKLSRIRLNSDRIRSIDALFELCLRFDAGKVSEEVPTTFELSAVG